MEQHKANIEIMTMMTMSCVRGCDLNSLVDYVKVKTYDIREGNVTIRRKNETKQHPFPRASRYKRGSDMDNGILEARVYNS